MAGRLRTAIMPFNSRPHAEVDSARSESKDLNSSFQLTTSRRGRHRNFRCMDHGGSFNSRPHAEVDTGYSIVSHPKILSTHDLTQRSTSTASFGHAESYLSTHDLTQRSTQSTVSRLRTMPFQLTTSRRGRLQMAFAMALGKVFQLTTSRRGRLVLHVLHATHKIFQLTTSRRGRLAIIPDHADLIDLSTHDLTQRSTSTTPVLWSTTKTFNSRPHAEVDRTVMVQSRSI